MLSSNKRSQYVCKSTIARLLSLPLYVCVYEHCKTQRQRSLRNSGGYFIRCRLRWPFFFFFSRRENYELIMSVKVGRERELALCLWQFRRRVFRNKSAIACCCIFRTMRRREAGKVPDGCVIYVSIRVLMCACIFYADNKLVLRKIL